MHAYYIVNKPRGIVSQFLSSHAVGLLSDLQFSFPEGTHAIGRLDKDSEGLLILTTDKRVTRLLFLAEKPHERTYLVMVQNEMTPETIASIEAGIPIQIKNGESYIARPLSIQRVENPELLYPFAQDNRSIYPHTWLKISLAEGKYRQVRKMMLAARHRCLRLVRLSISDLQLGELKPGEVEEISFKDFYSRLGIPVP